MIFPRSSRRLLVSYVLKLASGHATCDSLQHLQPLPQTSMSPRANPNAWDDLFVDVGPPIESNARDALRRALTWNRGFRSCPWQQGLALYPIGTDLLCVCLQTSKRRLSLSRCIHLRDLVRRVLLLMPQKLSQVACPTWPSSFGRCKRD
eukprot:1792442-Amphidinium_carterae.2